jgi:hypothetical protein
MNPMMTPQAMAQMYQMMTMMMGASSGVSSCTSLAHIVPGAYCAACRVCYFQMIFGVAVLGPA